MHPTIPLFLFYLILILILIFLLISSDFGAPSPYGLPRLRKQSPELAPKIKRLEVLIINKK